MIKRSTFQGSMLRESAVAVSRRCGEEEWTFELKC